MEDWDFDGYEDYGYTDYYGGGWESPIDYGEDFSDYYDYNWGYGDLTDTPFEQYDWGPGEGEEFFDPNDPTSYEGYDENDPAWQNWGFNPSGAFDQLGRFIFGSPGSTRPGASPNASGNQGGLLGNGGPLSFLGGLFGGGGGGSGGGLGGMLGSFYQNNPLLGTALNGLMMRYLDRQDTKDQIEAQRQMQRDQWARTDQLRAERPRYSAAPVTTGSNPLANPDMYGRGGGEQMLYTQSNPWAINEVPRAQPVGESPLPAEGSSQFPVQPALPAQPTPGSPENPFMYAGGNPNFNEFPFLQNEHEAPFAMDPSYAFETPSVAAPPSVLPDGSGGFRFTNPQAFAALPDELAGGDPYYQAPSPSPVKVAPPTPQVQAPAPDVGQVRTPWRRGPLSQMQAFADGGPSRGPGGGQDDLIHAKLSDGEYVMDAETVSALGDGSTEAGFKKLDQMRQNLRKHKRKASVKSIPPKAKAPEAYLK